MANGASRTSRREEEDLLENLPLAWGLQGGQGTLALGGDGRAGRYGGSAVTVWKLLE